MREKDLPRRVCEPVEPAPPVCVRAGQLNLGVESVGHAVEEPLLVADVPRAARVVRVELFARPKRCDGRVFGASVIATF